MGDIVIETKHEKLVALGLGSCIGFCAYDCVAKVSAMAHIMLPEEFPGSHENQPGKFANTGIPTLLDMMVEKGAIRSRIVVAYSGGAQVFKFKNTAGKLDVGIRNAKAVEEEVKKARLRCLGVSVGGGSGRSVTFCTESGNIMVKTVASKEVLLCNLKNGMKVRTNG